MISPTYATIAVVALSFLVGAQSTKIALDIGSRRGWTVVFSVCVALAIMYGVIAAVLVASYLVG